MSSQIRDLEMFIEDVVTRTEAQPGDKYRASFAPGQSGLSYGAWQNDVAGNNDAKTQFEQILLKSGLSNQEAGTIVAKAATNGVKSSNFTL